MNFSFKACLACETPFLRGGERVLFCSDRCRMGHAAIKSRTRPRKKNEKECPICLVMFVTTNTNKIYCSPLCAGRYLEEDKAPLRKLKRLNCSACGQFFLPRMRTHKFCSFECAKEGCPPDDKTCPCCFKVFKPRGKQKYCTSVCANRYREKDRYNIYARDKYTCFWCRQVKLSKQKLCLDHVVPVLKGGEDTASNLVTSCKVCNGKKFDKLMPGIEKVLATIEKRNQLFDIDPKSIVVFTYPAHLRRQLAQLRQQHGGRLEDT